MHLVRNPKIILPLLFLLSFLMHFRVFKLDLMGYHVWRQTHTQANIENFFREDFNIFHPKTNDRGDGDGIVRLEFPVMQWIFAGFYKLIGDYLIITRALSFITGIFSVLGIFFLLKNIFQNKIIALIGAWAFNFSPVFYYYTMNPIPDNFALCCSIWGVAFFFGWIRKKNLLKIVLAGFFLSLGALAKLPFILYFSVPLAYFLAEWKNSRTYFLPSFLLFIAVIPVGAWYYYSLPYLRGNVVLGGIFNESGLSLLDELDILQCILISTLPELLINYASLLFFLSGFYFLYRRKLFRHEYFPVFLSWGIFLSLYYLYEMNPIGKAHDYYLFPFLPPIFILVAYGSYCLLHHNNKFLTKLSFFLLLILPVTAYLRADARWNLERSCLNNDLLFFKKDLQNAVPSNSLCVVGNDESHHIWYYYIRKKGWAFENDNLKPEILKDIIKKGAKYLYCDSRKVDEHPGIRPLLDSLVIQKGSIRVFSLKN